MGSQVVCAAVKLAYAKNPGANRGGLGCGTGDERFGSADHGAKYRTDKRADLCADDSFRVGWGVERGDIGGATEDSFWFGGDR